MKEVPATILKTFPYSPDGLHVVMLKEGKDHDIRGDVFDGLKAAGFVIEQGAAPPPARSEDDAQQGDADASKPITIEKGPRGLFFAMQDGKRVSKGFATEDEAKASLQPAA